jgi:hypothetical protein
VAQILQKSLAAPLLKKDEINKAKEKTLPVFL